MFKGVLEQDAKAKVIEETAKQMAMPLEYVEKIFSFQFKDVAEATKSNNSIEINGLCRIYTGQTRMDKHRLKLVRAISKCHRQLETASDKKKESLLLKIEGAEKALNTLNDRIK